MGRALATMDLVGEAIPALGTCNRPTEAATAIAEVDAERQSPSAANGSRTSVCLRFR